MRGVADILGPDGYIPMSYALSPYDRETNSFDTLISLAAFFSVVFHVGMFWIFFYVLPGLMPSQVDRFDDFITVELLGSLAPAAPAAPSLEVDLDLKGPDVVEIPQDGPPPAPQPPLAPPDPVAPLAEIIPLGPTPPEKPQEITPVTAPPPTVTPPQVVKERSKPTTPSEAELLRRRMQELRRKVEAQNEEQLLASQMANIAIKLGQGTDEGSSSGGATRGGRVHPEAARYYGQIRDAISSNWLPPLNTLDAGLEAVYQITVEPDGSISDSKLLLSSGNAEYDLSVKRAVLRSSPLPPLPPVFEGQAQNPALVFKLQDLLQLRR